MEKEDPAPEKKPAAGRTPPRPPNRGKIGLEPDDDDSSSRRRHTITKTAEGVGKLIRNTRGRSHYAHVIVEMEPNDRGKGNKVVSEVGADKIPTEYIESVISGAMGALEDHPDFQLVDVVVRIKGGSFHATDSDDLAFKFAAIFAVKNAITWAEPIAIE